MATESRRGIRSVFITGLLILIPVVVTLAVLTFLFNFFDRWLTPVVNPILVWGGVPIPQGWGRIPGLGILATALLVFVTGLISRNYFGGRLIRFGHALLNRIPLVKNVYGGVSQLLKALTDAGATPFRTVVLVEFPRPGVWTLGFVSGDASAVANQTAGEELVNVFVPAAPIPSQGLYLLVARRELRVLPITTEEGFKMLATLGLIQGPRPGLAEPDLPFDLPPEPPEASSPR